MEKDKSVMTVSRRQLAAIGLGVAVVAQVPSVQAKPRSAAPLAVADRLAIEDLFSNYVWAYDCSDADEFISLFADDALVVGRGTLYRDREAILGWFRYLLNIRETEGDDIWMHEAGQFRFDGGGDSCIVYAYATHFNGKTTTTVRGVRSLGYFACECVKRGGKWKFRRFSITTWDRNMLPWKKPLPWANT